MRTQWWESDFPIKCSRAATQFWLVKNTQNTLHLWPLFLTLGWNKQTQKKLKSKQANVCSDRLGWWGFLNGIFFPPWLFPAHIETVGDITAMATSFIIKGFNLWQLSSRVSAHAGRTERHESQEHQNGKKIRADKQRAACLLPQLPTFGRDSQKELAWPY